MSFVLEEDDEVDEGDCILHYAFERLVGAETTKDLLRQLVALEIIIHELEDGLESVSIGLVKTRASHLNVLNYWDRDRYLMGTNFVED